MINRQVEDSAYPANAVRLPQELWIQPVNNTSDVLRDDPDEHIPHTTFLFRDDAQLEDVIDLGLQAYREGESEHQFSVVSAGSSVGAEAYGVLAYLSAVAPDLGKVSLVGVDTLPRLSDAAQAAQYRTTRPFFSDVERDLADTLPRFGFALEPYRDPIITSGLYSVDASKIRDAHDVEFRVGDLRNPNLEIPEADLILANNLLFHLSPDTAETVVRNLIGKLRDRGILSIGRGSKYTVMQSDLANNYPSWRRDLAATLEAEGIEPVLYEGDYWGISQRAPFVFRKTQTQ